MHYSITLNFYYFYVVCDSLWCTVILLYCQQYVWCHIMIYLYSEMHYDTVNLYCQQYLSMSDVIYLYIISIYLYPSTTNSMVLLLLLVVERHWNMCTSSRHFHGIMYHWCHVKTVTGQYWMTVVLRKVNRYRACG